MGTAVAAVVGHGDVDGGDGDVAVSVILLLDANEDIVSLGACTKNQ